MNSIKILIVPFILNAVNSLLSTASGLFVAIHGNQVLRIIAIAIYAFVHFRWFIQIKEQPLENTVPPVVQLFLVNSLFIFTSYLGLTSIYVFAESSVQWVLVVWLIVAGAVGLCDAILVSLLRRHEKVYMVLISLFIIWELLR